jgi:hypothetical protein
LRSLVPELLKQDPVWSHAQRALQELLGPDPRETLAILGVEQVHRVSVRYGQLARVLDSEETLLSRNEPDECFAQRRFARARGAADQDVLAGPDRELEEGGPVLLVM